jgi:hypothetical protein
VPIVDPAPRQTVDPAPRQTFEPAPRQTFEPAPRQTFEPAPLRTFEPQPQQLAALGPRGPQNLDASDGRGIAPGLPDATIPAFGSFAGTPAEQDFPAPKRSRTGLWLGLGGAGALVLTVVAALVIIVLPKFAAQSPHYVGAPIASSDVAAPGKDSVISPSSAVAVEVPTEWHNVQEYADLKSAIGTTPSGSTLVGAWFTKAPGTPSSLPQMVMVLELSPSSVGPGTMDDVTRGYLAGLEKSIPGSVFGQGQAFKTVLGLEGDRTDATFQSSTQNLSGTLATVMVAHGRRFVVTTWISYQGPIDEAGLTAFMATLRVDP